MALEPPAPLRRRHAAIVRRERAQAAAHRSLLERLVDEVGRRGDGAEPGPAFERLRPRAVRLDREQRADFRALGVPPACEHVAAWANDVSIGG